MHPSDILTKYTAQQLVHDRPAEEMYHYAERVNAAQVLAELQAAEAAQRTHACEHCGDSFTTVSNLASHMLHKHRIGSSKPKQKKCWRCRTSETSPWRRNYDRDGKPKGYLCNACYQLRRYHATKESKKTKPETHKEEKCPCITCRLLQKV